MNNENKNSTILEKIAQGDETAFRMLFDLYYQKLLHVAIYFLKSRELAEEAIADVFYIIWTKRENMKKVNDINSYLYIMTKNQALHYIRRASVIDKEPIDLYTINMLQDGNDPEKKLLQEEYQLLIQNAINSLPEKCREVFRLVLSDKLRHKDIAQLLNISEKTIEAHIASAYKRIAEYVNKEYGSRKTINKMLSVFF